MWLSAVVVGGCRPPKGPSATAALAYFGMFPLTVRPRSRVTAPLMAASPRWPWCGPSAAECAARVVSGSQWGALVVPPDSPAVGRRSHSALDERWPLPTRASRSLDGLPGGRVPSVPTSSMSADHVARSHMAQRDLSHRSTHLVCHRVASNRWATVWHTLMWLSGASRTAQRTSRAIVWHLF